MTGRAGEVSAEGIHVHIQIAIRHGQRAVHVPVFDTITATYQSNTQPLNQHVQTIVDQVVIMDYRDSATGPNGVRGSSVGDSAR